MVPAAADILFSGVNTCLDWGVKIAFIFLYFVTELENTNPHNPHNQLGKKELRGLLLAPASVEMFQMVRTE